MIYEPREDSFLLSRNLKKYVCGKSFLDMGSGSGIQSESAIKAQAKSVTAVDIDPSVIEHLTKKHIKSIHSDLFSQIKGKFDVIAFNPPYLPEDEREDAESAKVTSGGKKGDEITIEFLKQSVKHMNKSGVILLIVSSLTPQKRINSLISKLKLHKKVIDSEKLFMETLELWLLKPLQ